MSTVSICALVKPQATRPLLPTTMIGAPGRLTPTTSMAASASPSGATTSRARYQVLGTRMPRCMSLATMAAPWAVSAPATAQLLLPWGGGSAASGARKPVRRSAGAVRTSTTSGPGIGGAGSGPPTMGASQLVPSGNRKSARAGSSAS